MMRFLLLIVLAGVSSAWANCSVYVGVVSFGTYLSPIQKTDVLSSGAVSINCNWKDVGVPYTLKLSSLQAEGALKYLSNGKDKLYYNFYIDSGRTAIWGDGLSGTSTFSGTTTAKQDVPIYGMIGKNQSVLSGSYADTLTVQIDY